MVTSLSPVARTVARAAPYVLPPGIAAAQGGLELVPMPLLMAALDGEEVSPTLNVNFGQNRHSRMLPSDFAKVCVERRVLFVGFF